MPHIFLITALLVAALATACGSQATTAPSATPSAMPSAAAAIVNGREISQGTLNSRVQLVLNHYEASGFDVDSEDLVSTVRREVLNEMIDEVLLLELGEAQGITAQSTRVQTEYDALVGQFDSAAAFQTALEQEGITKEELTDSIIQRTVLFDNVQALVEAEGISDQEVMELYHLYREHVDMPPLEEVHMLLAEEIRAGKWQQTATRFMDELREGADIQILL